MPSSLEEAVAALGQGRGLRPQRQESFDFHSGLFHTPFAWAEEPAAPCPFSPGLGSLDQDVLGDLLQEFVRGEGYDSIRYRSVDLPRIEGRVDLSLSQVATLIRDSQENRVYGGALQEIIDFNMNRAKQIYQILCSSELGNPENQSTLSLSDIRELVNGTSTDPGFFFAAFGLPFRDQNHFRTIGDAHEVGLGEVYFLSRVHALCLALYQVVAKGAQITIVSDGAMYAPILGVSTQAASLYRSRLLDLRDSLNLQGTVSIIDVMSLVEQCVGGITAFREAVESLAQRLAVDEALHGYLKPLEYGLRWNVALDPEGDHAKQKEWLEGDRDKLTHSDGYLPPTTHWQTTCLYAAANLVLNRSNVLSESLRGFVRATVHPKAKQIGLPPVGSVHAWNGVACLSHFDIPEREIEMDVQPISNLGTGRQYERVVDDRNPENTLGIIWKGL